MTTLGQRLKRELGELIPVTAFFLAVFHLLAFTQSLMLKQYGIKASTFLSATIGALVVAKVVLIADHFPLVNRFPARPLIYNVVWKTAIYFAASFVVRYAEHLFHFWRHSKSLAEANRRLLTEVVWPHFWAVQIWLLIALLVYCSVRELIRALGRGRIVAMFFRDPAGPGRGRGASSPGP